MEQTGRFTWATSPSLAALFALMLWSTVSGEDVVWVHSQQTDELIRRRGTIIDWTGEALTLEVAGGRAESIPTLRVARIETQRGPDHIRADAAFDTHHYADALALYRLAVGAETRQWMRREILARCVWCFRNIGQIEQAGDTLLIILSSDSTTHHLAAAPLAWTTKQTPPETARAANQWIANGTSSIARLMGASWLLSGASRAVAQAELDRLASDPDPRIAFCAQAQRWRTQLGTVTADQLSEWQTQVERMPVEIRGGPYFILGEGWSRVAQHERAAVSLMRVVVHHPLERQLSARALYDAGRHLEHLGRPREARRVYLELARDFGDDPESQLARQRLDELNAGAGAKPPVNEN